MFERISIMTCWAGKQDVSNQVLLETQHVGRWKLLFTYRLAVEGRDQKKRTERHQIEVMAATRVCIRKDVCAAGCQRKVACLTCRTQINHIPFVWNFQDRFCSWNITILVAEAYTRSISRSCSVAMLVIPEATATDVSTSVGASPNCACFKDTTSNQTYISTWFSPWNKPPCLLQGFPSDVDDSGWY